MNGAKWIALDISGEIWTRKEFHVKRLARSEAMRREVSRDDIEAALEKIAPDCSQDVWWRIGAAVYSALGDDGFDVFDEWSAQSEEKYPGRRHCWRLWCHWRRYTVDCGNGRRPISVGTLFYFAETGCRS